MDKKRKRTEMKAEPEIRSRGRIISRSWTTDENASLPKYAPKGSNLSSVISALEAFRGTSFNEEEKRWLVTNEIDGIAAEFNFLRASSGVRRVTDVIDALSEIEKKSRSLVNTLRSLDEITLSYIIGTPSVKNLSYITLLPEFRENFIRVFDPFDLPEIERNSPFQRSKKLMEQRGPTKRIEALADLVLYLQKALGELHGKDKGGNSRSRDLGAEWTGDGYGRVPVTGQFHPEPGDKVFGDPQKEVTWRPLIRNYKDLMVWAAYQCIRTVSGEDGCRLVTTSLPGKSKGANFTVLLNEMFEYATDIPASDSKDANFEREVKFFVRYFKDWNRANSKR